MRCLEKSGPPRRSRSLEEFFLEAATNSGSWRQHRLRRQQQHRRARRRSTLLSICCSKWTSWTGDAKMSSGFCRSASLCTATPDCAGKERKLPGRPCVLMLKRRPPRPAPAAPPARLGERQRSCRCAICEPRCRTRRTKWQGCTPCRVPWRRRGFKPRKAPVRRWRSSALQGRKTPSLRRHREPETCCCKTWPLPSCEQRWCVWSASKRESCAVRQ
mmetsp:Transcript_66092/g.119012  ORF Transcript_66092/g.119012 Transcript_66092/m.119012 type:complete len:216 (+) Transcript_66092:148-795(+)